jgi:hypothetical protein
MKFFMKSLLLLTLTMIVACGESDEHQIIAQKTKTATSAITIAYGPIGKMGCGLESVNDEDSVSEYFSAAQEGEVLIAQGHLLKIHRDFRCMSAYDFVTHYNNIMDEIELNHSNARAYLYASPLVFLLSEHGGNHLDYRTQSWLLKASYHLIDHYDNHGVVASGIGFHYARGISLVNMDKKVFRDLMLSMESLSWFRMECPFIQSVIIRKQDDRRAIVCLNDPCPISDEILDRDILLDRELFMQYCNDAKNKLGSAKKSPSGGSGNSSNENGYGSDMLGDDSYSDAIGCANSYNEASDSFACLVQVAAVGQRTITENIVGGFNSFDVGVEAQISAEGCSPNPLAQSASPELGDDPQQSQEERDEEFRNRMSDLESDKEAAKTASERIKQLAILEGIYLAAKAVYELDMTPENSDDMEDAKLKWLSAVGASSDEEATAIVNQMVEDRDKLVNEIIKTEKAIKEDFPNMHAPYEASEHAIEVFERLKRGWDKSCDVSDPSGCSQSCSIADQQAEGMARCMGMNAVDARLTGDSDAPPTSGLGNPAEMVRTPEQVETDPAFSDLVSCMADAMGFDPSYGSPGDSCGSQILCTSHENASITEDGLGCSCAENPELDDFLDYQATMECQAIVLCGQEQTCSCGSFGSDLSQGGGLPPDPEVMLRTFAYPQESY